MYRYGAPPGRKLALFVDDLNMPQREACGAAPALELLRQVIDAGGMYDRRALHWKHVEDVMVCGACCPPHSGWQEVTPRYVLLTPASIGIVLPSYCVSCVTGTHSFSSCATLAVCAPVRTCTRERVHARASMQIASPLLCAGSSTPR